MKQARSILSLVALSACALAVAQAPVLSSTEIMAKSQAEAKATGRNVWVIFHASW
ncbi:MAG TPA: hypothetical protein VNI20_11725 [Fimbriimonadaceae bacterium]|nr:hypothetical protein [Fimbriimonadaceae bacterium]